MYLPSRPVTVLQRSQDHDAAESRIAAALSAAAAATVVRVDYRVGDGITYPTPVHDVLAAFDWVKANLVCAVTTSPGSQQSATQTARIGVCGQLLGGSLATMLALTESRLTDVTIGALAAHNPIVDWVFPQQDDMLDEKDHGDEPGDFVPESVVLTRSTGKTKKKKQTSWNLYQSDSALSPSTLLSMRESIFRKPAAYFDPFASPALFFRSPGADVPADPSRLTEEPISANGSEPPTRRRKVHRVFPPATSNIVLPRTLLSFNRQCILWDQNEELVRLMKRSIIRSLASRDGPASESDESEDDTSKAIGIAEAEKRIQTAVLDGPTTIWGAGKEAEWRPHVEEMGAWLQNALG